ncbi:amidohydrolase family protein [Spirosoma sp.]|uniref:amidohydrolase family protein n=1 Tax=Spirosoma sp. TaxID=1899569 RepID=UPI003B3B9482
MIQILLRCFTSLTFIILFAHSSLKAQPAEKHYLLKAGLLYDAEKNAFVKGQQILIKGSRIIQVGAKLDVPPNTQVLDFPHATVAPGLIDAHTHVLTSQGITEELAADAILRSSEHRVLRAVKYLKSYLAAGFTSIRDVGNSGQYLDVELRQALERRDIDGPRMFVSGPIIGSMDGQLTSGFPLRKFDHVARSEQSLVSGAEEASKAVKEHIARGVDLIKILAIGNRLTLSLEEMKAIVQTAHAHRLKVTAHCDRDWAAHAAIQAGVDGIEHAYGFKQATLDTMAQKGIYVVPTYGSVDGMAYYRKLTKQDYKLDELKKEFADSWGKWVLAIRKAGLHMVAGSDAYYDIGVPRGDWAKQTLRGYWDAGLTPEEVLQSSTINAARILNQTGELGVIKANALADIVVFNGDLKQNFSQALFDVALVMKEGRIEFQKTQP